MALFRRDLQRIARLRVREARALLDAGLFAGAYHIAGFAVECALKACIAKNVARHEFPDKKIAGKAWTHSIPDLIDLAALAFDLKTARTNAAFDANWAIVTKWNPETRYEFGVVEADARGLYLAITARTQGVLQWIRRHW